MIGPEYIYHPLGVCQHGANYIACRGYNFWSGIAGSFLTSLPGWVVALGLFLRHRNCHHKRCVRLGHNHPEHGWPACKRHWHETPEHVKQICDCGCGQEL